MIFPQNFDQIIYRIEDLVETTCNNIPGVLAQDTAYNLRLLGDAFQFITGITLAQYIRQRRLIHVAMYHLESGKSLEDSALLYGYPDVATMSKAFKRDFGVNPSQVTLNDLQQYPPRTIQAILSNRRINDMPEESHTENNAPKVMFGVTSKQFSSIRHILEVNAVYGLSEDALQLVSYLSNDRKVRLDAAFNFVEELSSQVKNGDFITCHDLSDIAEICCVNDVSMDEACELLDILQASGFDRLHDAPEGFCDVYFSDTNQHAGYSVNEILGILDALKQMGYGPYEFDFRMDYATYHEFDPVETILAYEEDDNMFFFLDQDPLIYQEEVPGIWEMSEEEYHKQ